MSPRDHKVAALIFGLRKKPEDDGEPDGDEASADDGGDADFDDAWREYADARDDQAKCDAMKAMIDLRIAAAKHTTEPEKGGY